MTTSDRGFRPDIQAFRALAVSLVFVYHLRPAVLPGGFIGVDIFFVISGYLITAHLLREVVQTGGVRVTYFWARRIRRLLPASFVVLAASLIATLIWLPKALWQQAIQSIAASALYVVNWVFASDSVNYLAAEQQPSIAQHYWSLSVEEQFYVVWPLLFLAALAIARLVNRATARRATIRNAVIAVFVASLAFSVVFTVVSPAAAYFVTATRAWEFAAGGLIAFLPAVGSPALRAAASWVGLVAIGASAALLTGEGFPGYIALVPVLGIALMMWAGNPAVRWSPTAGAGLRPVQIAGDLSYSIYLWHWPLIILYPYVTGHPPGLGGIAAIVALTVVLAFLTKRFVEDPVRRGTFWVNGRRKAYALAAGGMAVILVGTSLTGMAVQRYYETAGAPKAPFASTEQLAAEIESTLALKHWPDADQPPGDAAQAPEWVEDRCITVHEKDVDRCSYGSESAEKVVVVIGDSYASAFLPAIRAALEPAGWRVQVLTEGQCPIAAVLVHSLGETTEYTECTEHRTWANEFIAETQPDLVLGVSSSVSTLKRLLSGNTDEAAVDEWAEGSRVAFKQLAEIGVPTIMIGGPPRTNCGPKKQPADCPPLDAIAEAENLDLEKGIAEQEGIGFIDTRYWFCSPESNLCPDLIGSALVRADGSHLAGTFSKRLGGILADAIDADVPIGK